SNIAADIIRSFENSSCQAIAIDDREKAIKFALANSRAGDIILFAGKGHEKYQLVEGKKEYFCERELIIKHKEVIGAELPAVN
ncbi:MAG: UDP-N-acetylmuramoyl-L-alanyl-D-glutamate--2,6-diaminopimelate ligase, partial [Clostridia bacterium]|nr:UDP-N-acetylmuramoyl-L-alanyl-D-glutamate--2,6-diaminopimelate ligase [Clostridia bacterium]